VSCRKQNRAPWDALTADPAYTDASLTEKSENDGCPSQPMHRPCLKSTTSIRRDYLISIDVLSRAEQVSLMKKTQHDGGIGKSRGGAKTPQASLSPMRITKKIEKWRQSIRTQAPGVAVPTSAASSTATVNRQAPVPRTYQIFWSLKLLVVA